MNLGFFRPLKKEILALRAGQELGFDGIYLVDKQLDIPVAQLSQKMQAELSLWAEKGYAPVAATIRFIVAWRPKDAPADDDSAVLLADLTLKKRAPA